MACSSVGGGEFFQHFWRHTEILNDLCHLFPPPSPLFPPPGGGRWRICSHNLPHWSRHTQLFRWIREKVKLKPRSDQDRGLTSWPGLSRASHPRSLVVGPRSAFIDNCFNVLILTGDLGHFWGHSHYDEFSILFNQSASQPIPVCV